ncbi:hypothetical protein LCS78_16995 [Vibrio harveyi]|uniref:hypothetical protein n=1 Tax=Vibrio harveyi TaxID=669 RepID=UPI00237F5842|nr:hypothetical protein [Vibrio harveyi]HDM8068676.1 hypothetical protein [Vibrio harveyi]
MVNYKQVSDEIIDALVVNARQADIDEVNALTSLPFRGAIVESIENSVWTLSAYCDGDLLCVFGLSMTNMLAGYGSPWMIGTNSINSHKKDFWKASKEVIGWMKEYSGQLENIVHTEHDAAICWLSHLGFEFDEKLIDGLNGSKFKRFYLCVQ